MKKQESPGFSRGEEVKTVLVLAVCLPAGVLAVVAVRGLARDVQRMLDGQTDDYAHLPETKETRP